jgi:hypothetical protein
MFRLFLQVRVSLPHLLHAYMKLTFVCSQVSVLALWVLTWRFLLSKFTFLYMRFALVLFWH